jgi:hypothetical protein
MTFMGFDPKNGKTILIAAGLMIWGVIIWSFFVNGYLQTWSVWQVPAETPIFLDFRLIPGSAETLRSGIDPAISNPNDPLERLFNYPRIWYLLFNTGISQDDTIWICIVLLVLFFLIVFAFPEKLRARDAFLLLVIVFSPACMLLYERGNVDLIFFILVGLMILTLGTWPAVAISILSVASFFKLFPFFAVAGLLQENKKRFYALLSASTTIFLLYLVFNIESLKASWQLTWRDTYLSYGVYIIFDLLHDYVRYYLLQVVPEDQIQTVLGIVPHLTAFLLLAGMFFLAIRQKTSFSISSERNLAAFRVGASIYIGTFLLGNNWNYRLAFLIFAIPQFSQWLFASPVKQRWVYWGIFAMIFASCWDMIISYSFFQIFTGDYEFQLLIFDEIMNWGMFAGLAFLLFASAPAWFRSLSWNPFSQKELPDNKYS